jgi:hypothetical protein
MYPRLFLDVDPRTLRLPPSRWSGPDPFKLARQMTLYGNTVLGMPVIEVNRGTDDALVIADGVTRASRVAELLPGTLVRVEVVDDLPMAVGHYPSVGDFVP